MPQKKHRREVRLVPEGTKIQNLIMWYGHAQADKDIGRGQKQETRFEAKEGDGRSLANQIEQPPRKRGREVSAASTLGKMAKP